MDRDQEQEIIQDEDMDPRPRRARSMGSRREESDNDGMGDQGQDNRDFDVSALLNILDNELQNGFSVPFTKKCIVDLDLCMNLISDIRTKLPYEIEESKKILGNSQSIIADAKREAADTIALAQAQGKSIMEEADKRYGKMVADAEAKSKAIIADAEKCAQALVDQQEVMRRAQTEAQTIINQSRAEANERFMDVNKYVDDLLFDLESNVKAHYDDVHKKRQNLGLKR